MTAVIGELSAFIETFDEKLRKEYSWYAAGHNAHTSYTQTKEILSDTDRGIAATNLTSVTLKGSDGHEIALLRQDMENWFDNGEDEACSTTDSASDSGWQTEEDWEKGYLLESAVDHYPQNDMNRQMGQQTFEPPDHIKDYDFDYWCNFYEVFLEVEQGEESDVESPRENLGRIKSIAKSVRDIVSFIV